MFSAGDSIIAAERLGTAYGAQVAVGTAGTVIGVDGEASDGALLTVDFESVFGCVRLTGISETAVCAPGTVITRTDEPQASVDTSEIPHVPPVESPSLETRRVEPSLSVPAQSRAEEAAATAAQPEPSAPRPVPSPAPSNAPVDPQSAGGAGLIPFFVFRMFCSLRRDVRVTSSLSADELHGLFASSLHRPSGMARLGRMGNGYLGKARWDVQPPIRGQAVARCRPTGNPSHGFGSNPFFGKRYLDISNDTIELVTESSSSGASNSALVGPGVITTRWMMVAFPAMHLVVRSFLKAVKKADPSARFHYPWSKARMALWIGVIVLFVGIGISSSGGHRSSYAPSSSGTTYSTGGGSDTTGAVADPQPDPSTDIPTTDLTTDPATDAPSASDSSDPTDSGGIPVTESPSPEPSCSSDSPCTATVVTTTGDVVNRRVTPSMSGEIDNIVNTGDTVTLDCQTQGDSVDGPGGSTTEWARLSGSGLYLSAAYLSNLPELPDC